MRRTTTMTPTPSPLEEAQTYYVIHPLDDQPEEKCSPEGLAPLHLGIAQRLALMSLRGYLILMTLLVLFKAAALAGLFGLHAQ